MKAFLLAAGLGTRLGALTQHTAKCLLPIRDRPLLEIWLDLLRRHRISDVLINTHAHAEAVRQFVLGHTRKLSIRVSYEPMLLGSAGTVLVNRDWVASDPDFWIVYGDVLTNANLLDMLQWHRETRQLATIGVYRVEDPRRCGIVELDRNATVRSFVEKPQIPASDLAFAGVLVASPRIFRFIPARLPADIGYDLLPGLVGRMAAFLIRDYLIDIGTPENYAAAQRDWPGFVPCADEPVAD